VTIAELIAQKLAEGLPHPGNPAVGEEPCTIRLPLFKMPGMPAEMAQQVEETVKMLGEAIVYTIESAGHSTIIDTAELDQLRADLAAATEGKQ